MFDGGRNAGKVRDAVRLSLEEDGNGRPLNDCNTCWSMRRQALRCPKGDPAAPDWTPDGPTRCRVPAIESDPWVLSVLRASNIEPGLGPQDVCLWYFAGIETARAERGRVLRERMQK